MFDDNFDFRSDEMWRWQSAEEVKDWNYRVHTPAMAEQNRLSREWGKERDELDKMGIRAYMKSRQGGGK